MCLAGTRLEPGSRDARPDWAAAELAPSWAQAALDPDRSSSPLGRGGARPRLELVPTGQRRRSTPLNLVPTGPWRSTSFSVCRGWPSTRRSTSRPSSRSSFDCNSSHGRGRARATWAMGAGIGRRWRGAVTGAGVVASGRSSRPTLSPSARALQPGRGGVRLELDSGGLRLRPGRVGARLDLGGDAGPTGHAELAPTRPRRSTPSIWAATAPAQRRNSSTTEIPTFLVN